MIKSVHPFMQEDSQLRYKKWHTAINTFCCLYKTKKKYLQKTNAHFHLSILSFHWKQSKKHSYFWEEWVGDITFFILFFKTIFASSVPPQPHLNLPLLQVMNSYGRGMSCWAMGRLVLSGQRRGRGEGVWGGRRGDVGGAEGGLGVRDLGT